MTGPEIEKLIQLLAKLPGLGPALGATCGTSICSSGATTC